MAADPTGRAPAKHACIYWKGACTATDYFDVSDISCYNGSTCDGFGTCRGCSKYDQGGLKYGFLDAEDSSKIATPMHHQLYNIRAKSRKCCNWNGSPVEFKSHRKGVGTPATVQTVENVTENGSVKITSTTTLGSDFDSTSGSIKLYREGTDQFGNEYPTILGIYTGKEDSALTGVSLYGFASDEAKQKALTALNAGYLFQIMGQGSYPVMKSIGSSVDESAGERRTLCVLQEAAPWQEGLTEENQYELGCNGAKAECPYYTGPSYEEVVDEKMDKGDRITAKQIMELRFYSKDWYEISNRQEVWNASFSDPYIWAWAREFSVDDDNNVTYSRHEGKIDASSNKPLLQKVGIADLSKKYPVYFVGAPVFPSIGSPVVGGPPTYPTHIKELEDLSASSKVIFPKDTSISEPFVKKIFSDADRSFFICAEINEGVSAFAVNLTKNPQGNLSDDFFIKQIKTNNPEDILTSFDSVLPGKTFNVELEPDGSGSTINHIRIYIDTGKGTEDAIVDESYGILEEEQQDVLPSGERLYERLDVYIQLKFYHGEVAQNYFSDRHGHSTFEPWINHFTKFQVTGNVYTFGTGAKLKEVLWNSISSEGKKTMYSIEEVKTSDSSSEDITWESLDCNHILATFNKPEINRVAPWKAWGESTNKVPLGAKLIRTENTEINRLEAEDGVSISRELELEPVFATTDGSILPANMYILRVPSTTNAVVPVTDDEDILEITYAYTEYKQGPLKEADKTKLKYKKDLDNRIIDVNPYELTVSKNGLDDYFNIEGTFIKVGDKKFYSCYDILGECYENKSEVNEDLAKKVFVRGGVGEEEIKFIGEMFDECKESFNSKYTTQQPPEGEEAELVTFEDGTEVTFELLSEKVKNLYLKEGSLHYMFVFEDEDGRPIGSKNTAMLMQSSVSQCRDVEIKYKWKANYHHYPNLHNEFLLAGFYEPLFATEVWLATTTTEYEPFCGDHSESESFLNAYTAFSLDTDLNGALWYPYNNCQNPRYHIAAEEDMLVPPVEYQNDVEGFTEGRRRTYWEKSRVWDRFVPWVMYFIQRIGCYWSERTTTAELYGPFVFTGYTKIRSLHYFGNWSTDRESIRISRHWEKRNLTIEDEIVTEDDDGNSLTISDEFNNLLYGEDGFLNTGADVSTPIWVHITDGFSVVTPTSESISNPLGRYLLQRTGTHTFSESHKEGEDARYGLNEIFKERDYTISLSRDTDGTKIFDPDDNKLNVEGGTTVEEDFDSDIRYSFVEGSAGGDTPAWAWVASPPEIERPIRLVTGVSLKNPEATFFKEDRTPANFTEEGTHTLEYFPYEFDTDGKLVTPASISLDGGPPLYFVFKSGVFDPLIGGVKSYVIEENFIDGYISSSERTGEYNELWSDLNLDEDEPKNEPPSPYSLEAHESGDYSFILQGSSNPAKTYIVLADSQGVQRFEVNKVKYGTFSGVLLDRASDLNELPYDLSTIGAASGFGQGQEEIAKIVKRHDGGESFETGLIDLKGHFYIESISVLASQHTDFDVPSISANGITYPEGQSKTLFSPTGYASGSDNVSGLPYSVTIPVNARLRNINISFGARRSGKKFNLLSLTINYREPKYVSETITTYSPKATVSTGNKGNYNPSDLEFYFSRSYPDFAKDFSSGYISTITDAFGFSSTELPGTSVKYNSRIIKDVIPQFEFTDPLGGRFAYDNIDISQIPSYVDNPNHFGGGAAYIDAAITTSSKGWTMYTTGHSDDPGGDLTHEFAYDGGVPLENLQEEIYNSARGLLGDGISIYKSFWHPKEIEVFSNYGINLENYSWELELHSITAPLRKIFKHEEYGCDSSATSEYFDGHVHKIEPWQAKGAFHYTGDPKYNDACVAIVMNKLNYFFFKDYGTSLYLDNDVISRFTYTFTIPPNDLKGYQNAGLIDTNYIGGVIGGGFLPFSSVFSSASYASQVAFQSNYNSNRGYSLDTSKPSGFQ